MEIRQAQFLADLDASQLAPLAALRPHLVMVFGAESRMDDPRLAALLNERFAGVPNIGCSTAGEISDKGVSDGSVVITAIRFREPAFRVASVEYSGMADSEAAGVRLAHALAGEGLHAMLVLGQGVNINGSALVQGIAKIAGAKVALGGGLAADGGRFQRTLTLCNGEVSGQHIVGLAFMSKRIGFLQGSFGGWQPFGATRLVTRSDANVLYELDGEPALDIYRRYLGEYARDLPASGLLFPLAMVDKDHQETGLIRTILAVDEVSGSITLAGDIVEGGYLRLMAASTDALVDGAEAAARAAQALRASSGQSLALLVSCVGRKLVMGGRVDEEVEAVSHVFGQHAVITGFYSNGEIGPYTGSVSCQLHNQTMTIACISE